MSAQNSAGTPLQILYRLATPVTYQLTPAETKSVLNQLGYDGNRLTVSLLDSNSAPLTVYGGTLDVTTGELTVTWVEHTFDGSESFYLDNSDAWAVTTDSMGLADYPPKIITPNNSANRTPLLCSHYRAGNQIGAGNGTSVGISKWGNTSAAFIPKGNTTSTSECRAWLAEQNDAGTPFQLAYQLANPVAYRLTPAQLATLSGYNSVTTDTGTLSVTYRADTALSLGGD